MGKSLLTLSEYLEVALGYHLILNINTITRSSWAVKHAEEVRKENGYAGLLHELISLLGQ